jgi:hypothetical protein
MTKHPSIYFIQQDIEQNEVWMGTLHMLENQPTGTGLDKISRIIQDGLDNIQDVRVVVHNQDTFVHPYDFLSTV